MKSGAVISIVIPVYNEAEGIRKFHEQLLIPNLAKTVEKPHEIIYVNDGSQDDTLDILRDIASGSVGKIKVVALSRNFGKEIATTAGLFSASGEAVIVLDADGQHPPERIVDFLSKWKSGAQVVVGIRTSNEKEGFIKKLGSKLFYRLFNGTTDLGLVPGSTDFRLIDRAVVEEFKKIGEQNRITRGLIDWLGFRREFVYFDSPPRLAGKASYSVRQLFRLAVNSLVSLSLKPLLFLGVVGIGISLLSFLVGLFIFIEQILFGDPLGLNFTGTAMLGIFIAFLVGLVIIAQGVIAVYLSHIHTQSQQRPLFVIDHSSSYGISNTQ